MTSLSPSQPPKFCLLPPIVPLHLKEGTLLVMELGALALAAHHVPGRNPSRLGTLFAVPRPSFDEIAVPLVIHAPSPCWVTQ
jgi:hypothetical protein